MLDGGRKDCLRRTTLLEVALAPGADVSVDQLALLLMSFGVRFHFASKFLKNKRAVVQLFVDPEVKREHLLELAQRHPDRFRFLEQVMEVVGWPSGPITP